MIQCLSNIYNYINDNVTYLHVCSFVLSIISILIAMIFFRMKTKRDKKTQEDNIRKSSEYEWNSLQAKYKIAKQKLLEKQLSTYRKSTLKEEQRLEEETLKTVMELLQQQSGSEESLTLEELHKQLNMYRLQT